MEAIVHRKDDFMKIKRAVIMLILSLFIVGCSDSTSKDLKTVDMKELDEEKLIDKNKDQEELNEKTSREELKVKLEKLEKENKKLTEEITTMNNISHPDNLLSKSLKVMNYIKIKNFQELSAHVHPSKGVRFSPYFFVDEENHKVFTAKEIAGISQNTDKITWGTEDGTRDSIKLNFSDYYDKYIYDNDYVSPHIIGIDHPIGQGNITDNVSNIYKDGKYIEYHFTGFDDGYDGMDWRSLRLIFEKDAGTWYLVGVTHGQWTI